MYKLFAAMAVVAGLAAAVPATAAGYFKCEGPASEPWWEGKQLADIIGTPVLTVRDREIGKLARLLVNGGDGKLEAYIVNIGGFMGLGTRPVALGPNCLEAAIKKNRTVLRTPITTNEFVNMPTFVWVDW